MINYFARLTAMTFLMAAVCMANSHQKIAISPNGYAYYSIPKPNYSKKLFKFSPASNSSVVTLPIPNSDHCGYSDMAIDNYGLHIAIASSCSIPGAKPPKEADYHYLLTVVDLNSNETIAELNNALYFSFSPDGKGIAYVEEYPGERERPTPPGFKGGLWIYDFSSQVKKRIDNLGVVPVSEYRPQDINWSEHDGNVYYTNYGQVLRYNVKLAKSEIVPYKGIYFSADGKYYAKAAYEGGGGIYRASDNKEMTDWAKLMLAGSPSQYQDLGFIFWSKKYHAGVFSVTVASKTDPKRFESSNVVFDTLQGKVLGQFQGGVIGTNADGSLVAISSPGKGNEGKVEVLNLGKVINKCETNKP